MYKIASLGLLGFLALLIIPASSQEVSSAPLFYGGATLTYYDVSGNERFSQTVHNQLFDEGELLITSQVFADLTANAIAGDTVQVGAICIQQGTIPTTESDSLATANAADTANNANRCKSATTVTESAQVVTLTETFTTGTNWTSGDTINGVLICAADTSGANQADCTGVLFAVVNTSDVTPTGTETVTITYTFDISSGST